MAIELEELILPMDSENPSKPALLMIENVSVGKAREILTACAERITGVYGMSAGIQVIDDDLAPYKQQIAS